MNFKIEFDPRVKKVFIFPFQNSISIGFFLRLRLTQSIPKANLYRSTLKKNNLEDGIKLMVVETQYKSKGKPEGGFFLQHSLKGVNLVMRCVGRFNLILAKIISKCIFWRRLGWLERADHYMAVYWPRL